ncbi:hypothetical protein Bca4012_094421 [Brassica carinata]|uniref:Uncharacterized protein n=1 Tax=Brassica carinata TaxID=52824 RepID=A0A8X7PU20_BRACI|nr:hypothetical protein Bca52824_076539 [Brassica carinata]
MVASQGILRQCPQESPLANGQILIDGQVLIRLLVGSMTNMRGQVVDKGIEIMISQLSKGGISEILDKISQAAREESQGVSWI